MDVRRKNLGPLQHGGSCSKLPRTSWPCPPGAKVTEIHQLSENQGFPLTFLSKVKTNQHQSNSFKFHINPIISNPYFPSIFWSYSSNLSRTMPQIPRHVLKPRIHSQAGAIHVVKDFSIFTFKLLTEQSPPLLLCHNNCVYCRFQLGFWCFCIVKFTVWWCFRMLQAFTVASISGYLSP